LSGSAQAQTPDISGTYWATEYHAKIQLVGGGDLPLTAAGKYSRDWQARFVYKLRNDIRLEDYVCGEPHRDLSQVAGVRRP
jgi:hypothetical protein